MRYKSLMLTNKESFYYFFYLDAKMVTVREFLYFNFFSFMSPASTMSHTAVQGSIGSRSAMGMHKYKVIQ